MLLCWFGTHQMYTEHFSLISWVSPSHIQELTCSVSRTDAWLDSSQKCINNKFNSFSMKHLVWQSKRRYFMPWGTSKVTLIRTEAQCIFYQQCYDSCLETAHNTALAPWGMPHGMLHLRESNCLQKCYPFKSSEFWGTRRRFFPWLPHPWGRCMNRRPEPHEEADISGTVLGHPYYSETSIAAISIAVMRAW